MESYHPLFAVPMGCFKIEDRFIQPLVNAIYHFSQDESKNWSHALASEFSNGQEIIIPHNEPTDCEDWEKIRVEFLNSLSKETIEYVSTAYDIASVDIASIAPDGVGVDLIEVWANIQRPGDYNPVHTHSGHIAGTAFLKVPHKISKDRRIEQLSKQEKISLDGSLNFVYGRSWSIEEFSLGGSYRVDPKVGEGYIFPCWLNHTVYPFKGNPELKENDRISIAWNYKLNWDRQS